jgi:uncharacterized membrane protein YbhN (UPF0104 family)
LVIVDVIGWLFILIIQLYSLYYIVCQLTDVKPNFWLIFGSINAVNAIAYFVPTPGASGGIEFTYQTVLSKIIGDNEISLKAITSWRFVSYYLQIFFGMVLLGIFNVPKLGGKG